MNSRRKIAIIGAGQAGLQLGIHLQKQGDYEVSLVTEKSADQILNGRILSSQVLFNTSVTREKRLGLNFWDEQCISNSTVTFSMASPDFTKPAIHWLGYVNPYQSIDQRLKLSRWMNYFEALDGNLIIQNVDVKSLDSIAKTHELTIVSAGKREISQLFPRDDARSHFHNPQRALACLAVKGMLPAQTPPGSHVNVIPNVGEYFTTPGLTKEGDCEMMIFEGLPNGPIDCWDNITSAKDFLNQAKKLLKSFIPWEEERCAAIELIDQQAFLAGRFTPIIRQPTFISACGKPILGLGDTLVLNDPIAAQGANHACKSAFLYGEMIIDHGDLPYDEQWMRSLAETSWHTYGRPACELSELLLAPPRDSDLRFFKLAMEDQTIANNIAKGLDDPASLSWLLRPELNVT